MVYLVQFYPVFARDTLIFVSITGIFNMFLRAMHSAGGLPRT